MAAADQPQSERKKSVIRSNFLIFPKFQLTLIGTNLLVMLVFSAIVWLQMDRAFSELRVIGGASGIEADFYRRYLSYHADKLQSALLFALFFGIALSTILTLVISHRFSGPLIRLRHYFHALSKGEFPLPRLKFRRGDFLGDIPPAVNQAIGIIEQKIKDQNPQPK